MHVRLAPSSERRRLKTPAVWALTALVLSVATMAVGCGAPTSDTTADESDFTVDLAGTPQEPLVGLEATTMVRLTDRTGDPIRGARLQVEAHMNHPGMAPVIAPAAEREDGWYIARPSFTMAGEWALFVSGDLSDGTRVRARAGNVRVLARPGG